MCCLYCILNHYCFNTIQAVDYDGGRTLDDLVKYIEEQMGGAADDDDEGDDDDDGDDEEESPEEEPKKDEL